MRKLLLTLVAVSIAALVAIGCGRQDEAASGASELVPAGSVIYGEATLKPEGDQKEAIDTILSKFPGGGQAGDKLKDLIEKGHARVGRADQLQGGHRALARGRGGVLRHRTWARSGGTAAGLIATDDEDKARAALEKSAEGKLTKHDYKDVEYLTDESEEAGAVFDGFLVLGTEEGVKAAIDTSKGGKKLSDDENYNKALDDAADDRLGFFYMNSPQLLQTLRESGAPLPDSFRKFFEQPLVLTVDADKDGVTFEGSLPKEIGAAALFGQASDLVEQLPGDSWVGVAQTDLGKLIDYYVDAVAGMVGGRDAIAQQLKAATGLDLQKDVIDWMGDFAIFARGNERVRARRRADHRDQGRGRLRALHLGAREARQEPGRQSRRPRGPAVRTRRRRGLHAHERGYPQAGPPLPGEGPSGARVRRQGGRRCHRPGHHAR